MGKFLDEPYIQNPDSIGSNVTEIHITSDSSTPTDVSNTLGSVSVSDTDFTWSDVSTTNQDLQLASKDITYNADGIKRHLVGWDGASVVFATPVTEENVANGQVQATPANLSVADVTFNA